MRALLIGIAAVLPICIGQVAYPEALDTDMHRTCLSAPDTRCLLELAQIERDEFWRVSPGDADVNQDNWLEHVVRVELPAGELSRAASHLAQMDARELRWFVINEYEEYPDLLPGIDDEGKIRDALEAQLAREEAPDERASKGFELRADTAWALFGLGYEERATDVVNRAIEEFIAVVDAGDTEVVVAASDLIRAAVDIGAEEAVERLVRAISRPEMAEKGYSEDWPGWTSEAALRVYARAMNKHRMVEAPAEVTASPQAPAYDRLQAALAWALADNMDKVITYIRGLPLGNDQDSRFVQINALVDDLLEHERPDLALMVAEEETSVWARNNHIMAVAVHYFARGQVSEAEMLLSRISDNGARAALLIWLAREQAGKGEQELARELLDRGVTALSNEPDQARQTFLNIDIGSVHAALGDPAAARTAVDTGLKSIRGIHDSVLQGVEDPMKQFEAAVRAATVLASIGDGMEALEPIRMLVGLERPADLALGAFETAKALSSSGKTDLAAELVGSVLNSMARTEGIGHEDWSYLYLTAAEALISPQ